MKKKIGIDAHAIGLKQGGNETYIKELIKEFTQIDNTEFEFFIFLTEGINIPDFLRNKKNFSIIKVSINPFLRFFINIPISTHLKKLNLLHTQYILPFFTYCPGLITVHDVSFLRYPELFPKNLYFKLKLLLPYNLKKAKKIITDSQFSKEEILKFYRIEEKKIEVIYCGVSEIFRKICNDKKEEILNKYGIRSSYILTVSNLQPRKNLKRLIKAYTSILKKKKDFPYNLVIVGKKSWLFSEIFEEIRNSNFSKKIILTGYVPENELVYLYNYAEIFVYPSLYEGFGLPVLESMACGTPVITSNRTSLPEIAGDAALFVDPENENEIEKAIIEIIENKKLKEELIKKGNERIKLFSWKETAKKTIETYKSILQNEK
ncbi:MAG: glycosyltransferase family 4 protein [Candidatus Omnitrophica bacterium]|nr:glycosyltransferase family 4 protein [Candidatus Omnitrophota bacterium]MCM8806922.1 glycosyltransferase family 4 protein [Candidatus Omnitrophota bacterium]